MRGEEVPPAVAESTVNEVVREGWLKSSRCVGHKGPHLLLQVRTKTLNNELKGSFKSWYPKMQQSNHSNYLPLAV